MLCFSESMEFIHYVIEIIIKQTCQIINDKDIKFMMPSKVAF